MSLEPIGAAGTSFMHTLRRFLMLQLLMLWQGGFLFYAAFVVPTGTEVLGSTETQGAITARVTDSLNRVGIVALVLLGWELLHLAGLETGATRRVALLGSCWLLAVLCHVALFVLHARLDGMMDPERTFVVQRANFYRVHGIYLWTSTVQWLACLVLTWFLLRAWRNEANRDR